MLETFNIPSYMLLPEDEIQIHQYTDEDEKQLSQEIETLKSQYRRVSKIKWILNIIVFV